MLQYTAVYPGTLELLKSLMIKSYLSDFNLVGGTSLALQIGHRISIDIDLFTENKNVDFNDIKSQLENDYKLSGIVESKAILIQNIEYPESSNIYIKVDLVKYPYKAISPVIITDGIRLLSKEDIIPMKLSAIANRGSKKDFYDIYFLLQEYSLKQMFEFFESKYANHNYFHVIKSLTYFDDAEKDISPKVIKECSWKEIKQLIQKKVREYL